MVCAVIRSNTICFCGEIRKILCGHPLLPGAVVLSQGLVALDKRRHPNYYFWRWRGRGEGCWFTLYEPNFDQFLEK